MYILQMRQPDLVPYLARAPAPKDVHTACPQDGVAPSTSALIILAPVSRLGPFHAVANLELQVNTSK